MEEETKEGAERMKIFMNQNKDKENNLLFFHIMFLK
jgi:hypothetical protein